MKIYMLVKMNSGSPIAWMARWNWLKEYLALSAYRFCDRFWSFSPNPSLFTLIVQYFK